jgi:molybdopterin synthase catalytic subunit
MEVVGRVKSGTETERSEAIQVFFGFSGSPRRDATRDDERFYKLLMKVEIRASQFDPWKEATAYETEFLRVGKHGAKSIFIGSMRDMNEGDAVASMVLEHYPEMTQKHLEQIAFEALDKFDILDALIIHRVGEVKPSDPIVCVVVWSVHRGAAYDANRFIMEDLKAKAPFWKKETLANAQEDKQRWVEKNTPGQ